MKRMIVFIVITALLYIVNAQAEVPLLISYQGVLKDSTGEAVEDNVYALQFSIYDSETEGNLLWQSEGFVPIQTTNGLFSHVLGSTNPIPDSISQWSSLWLGITVDLDEELPRVQIVSVPFSLSAQKADTASVSLDKTIDASELTDGTLDTARYSAYSDLISENKIGTGSDQIAAGDHVHQGYPGIMMRIEDTTLVSIQWSTYEEELIKSITITSGVISHFFRISFAIFVGGQSLQIRVRADGELLSDFGAPGGGYHTIKSVDCIKMSNNEWVSEQDDINITPEAGVTIEIYAYISGGIAGVTMGNLIVEYDED